MMSLCPGQPTGCPGHWSISARVGDYMEKMKALIRRHRELAVAEAEATEAAVVGTGTERERDDARERLRTVEWWLLQSLTRMQ